MCRATTFLVLIATFVSVTAKADLRPAAGRFLVATEDVQGEIFARTVILLLHYDDSGAMGIVVNRPTDVRPAEVMRDPHDLSDYGGTLYWGGPVEMETLLALVRSDSPPEGATPVVDHVYLVPFDDTVLHTHADPSSLRLYLGYAGWAPGQLDLELASDSWDVVSASEESVFDQDPESLWRQLAPSQEYRAAVDPAPPPDRAAVSAARPGFAR